jgi:hypothetical protein
MNIKDRIRQIIDSELQRLRASGLTESREAQLQRRRLNTLAADIEEIAGAVDSRFVVVERGVASMKLQAKWPGNETADIAWKIAPGGGDQVVIHMEELRQHPDGPETEEKWFPTESDLVSYLVDALARQVAQYRYREELLEQGHPPEKASG